MENQENYNQTRPRRRGFSFSPKLLISIIVGVILVFALLTSFFVVDQTENAVVLRFGKYVRTVGPGLQTKIPFGIEKNYNVQTQVVQTLTFGYHAQNDYTVQGQNNAASKLGLILGEAPVASGSSHRGAANKSESQMLTGDLNIVDVEWIVQYYISDPRAWLFNVHEREKTIRDISQSVMNQLVGDLPILSVMTDQRTQIEYDAQIAMQKIFDRYDMGIQIVTVKLQNIVPPEGDVQDAFEDVNKAIQDMNRYINEGKEYYNQQIPAAQGEAEKLVLQAQGYAAERVNNAKGDAERFDLMLDSYKQSEDITKTRLYIETMEQILLESQGNMTLIDRNLENYLPFQTIGGTK